MVEIVKIPTELTQEEQFGLALQSAFETGRLSLTDLVKFLNDTKQ